jgi:hypothetical protein
MIQSGITKGTPTKILFGAGVYFEGVSYDEKTAPTEEAIIEAIIGATQEGGTLTITPEFFAPELDGALVAIRELQRKIGETAIMEVSFAELEARHMKNQVIGKLGETTDKSYDVITSDDQIRAGHFYDGFGFYGELMDGRPVIILFKQALCTSGFTADPKPKTNSVFKGTLTCMSDLDYGVTRLPYAIFIRKADGWTAVNAEEAA